MGWADRGEGRGKGEGGPWRRFREATTVLCAALSYAAMAMAGECIALASDSTSRAINSVIMVARPGRTWSDRSGQGSPRASAIGVTL